MFVFAIDHVNSSYGPNPLPSIESPMSTRQKIIALVDCNNFYASCERIFNPRLEGKPVVVLSNNDGCIIARSDEAKQLGIRMGVPAFEISSLLEKNNVAVFSTNYELYGDISRRVMTILAQFSPSLEIYSIDEAFLDLTGLKTGREEFGKKIACAIRKWTGIPVTIGIAPTKTLAKIANHVAKEKGWWGLVLEPSREEAMDCLLQSVPIEEVWGIGPQFAAFLNRYHAMTAYDLKKAPEKWVRQHLGIVGVRTVSELRGQSCYTVANVPAGRKGLCISRSFGKATTVYEEVEQATTAFVATVAEKLRRQKAVAQALTVFVMTNRFAKGPHYVNGMTLQLPVATNSTIELIHHTVMTLKKLYRKGYNYKKSGVIATEIIPEETLQCSLWDDVDREKHKKITAIMDSINARMGKGKIKFAIQGTQRSWKMRQEKLSPAYTTKWDDLLTIDITKE
jgi:DNA polymerase V